MREDALTKRDPSATDRAANAGGSVIVVVHTLAHAVGVLSAATRAARPVTILSAADAGIYAGPGWFGAVIKAACEAVPDARFSALLDCGDRPGAALAALRAGIESIIFTGREDVAARLADIARQHRARLLIERPVATLDLVDDFFASEADSEQRCTAVFAQTEVSPSKDRPKG